MVAVASPPATMKEHNPHRIDSKGAIYCRCGKRLGFRVGFLSPAQHAEVVIYRECKYCGLMNLVFLDRLEMTT